MLKAGDVAPDFTTVLDDETIFTLSDWHGKKHVILYFYPSDFTRGCTTEACGFRDTHAAIEAQDAIVVGVSPDSTESHRRFRHEHGLPFLLVADTERKVIGLYDVARTFAIAKTKRVTYLIDKAGTIRNVYHHELAIGRHKDEVLEGLKSINKMSEQD
jgi:peroxiredoxin Q/BCP